MLWCCVIDASAGCRYVRRLAVTLLLVTTSMPAAAQDNRRVFVGALFGVSALSADARAVTDSTSAAVSLYDPANGPAVNVFGGVHLVEYFSIQANWMWNRNNVTLLSSFAGSAGGGFVEQRRHSRQHAFVLDGLIYFRRRDSLIRPYLGTGLSLIRFSSDAPTPSVSAAALMPPAGAISSTQLGLRSHVGIDFRFSRYIAFRYSFSETISGNPISQALTPPGRRGMMNFQNLFGLVGSF